VIKQTEKFLHIKINFNLPLDITEDNNNPDRIRITFKEDGFFKSLEGNVNLETDL